MMLPLRTAGYRAALVFISVLSDHPVFDISELADCGESGYVVSVLLAKDEETSRHVFVDAKLVYVHSAQFWEFSFTISVIALDEDFEPFATQDREMAAPYIPTDMRSAVIEIVRTALRVLVNHAKPAMIYRVTNGSGLPEKALRKHHLLTETLIEAGYDISHSGTDRFERTFWFFERGALNA
jgi:hypothetical protein